MNTRQRSRRQVFVAGAVCAALLAPCAAHAQTNTQLWSEFTFDWIKSKHTTIGVDVEPKVLLSAPSGDPGWSTLDVTPSVEYARGQWFDLIGELHAGWTKQTDDLNSTEITPRIGFRLHLLSNLREDLFKERQPKRRLVVRDFMRVEWRNLFYSTDKPDSSTVRFRNRLEMLWPINRHRITENGASYLTTDWEWFIPVDDPSERFANKQRIRAGLGYRRSRAWHFEAKYVWDRSRNTIDEPYTNSDHAIDLVMKRVW